MRPTLAIVVVYAVDLARRRRKPSLRQPVAVGLCCLVGFVLAGCGTNITGDIISHDIAVYQAAAAKAGNDLLLENILRARDSEPLHFQEVSQIHGAATVSGTIAASVPFGSNYVASKNTNSLAVGGSISSQPAFDLGTLDTQDFIGGIGEPVAPEIIQRMLTDNLIDSRMLVALMFSRVRDPRSGVAENSIECLAASGESQSCRGPWMAFWRGVDRGGADGQLIVHSIDELRAIGPPLKGKDAADPKTYASLDPQKFRLHRTRDGYQLLSVSNRYAVCWQSGTEPLRLVGFLGQAIGADEGSNDELCRLSQVLPPLPDGKSASVPPATIETRSVIGLTRFLGQLVALQRKDGGSGQCNDGKSGTEMCVILGRALGDLRYESREKLAQTSNSGAAQSANAPAERPLFKVEVASLGISPVASTTHHGENYSVKECNDSGGQCDYSRQTLFILNYLLDLQKSSKNIPETLTVRALPGG